MFDNNQLLEAVKNENFSHYSYKAKDLYDFFIYSPLTFQRKDSENILDDLTDIQNRPVFSDHELSIGQSPHIEYKIDIFNPTKYYLKINLQDKSPFVIQFNQAFNKNWKIKWLDEYEYDNQNCINKAQFPITDNTRCQHEGLILDPRDINFLKGPILSEENHLRTNILGNGWLVELDKIPESFKKDSSLYAVIIYTKQIYYTYTIIIAGTAFIILLLLSIIQEGSKIGRRIRNK